MAKEMESAKLTQEKPQEMSAEKSRKSASGAAEMNPTMKVALLVRYRPNAKEAAIAEAFETFGDGTGLTLSLPSLGLSRRYEAPQSFPVQNDYVPGHAAAGWMFVKFESIV